MKRIHIVGCPRSGTTLALEAMAASFDIDGYSSKEQRFWKTFRVPEHAHRVYLSKQPADYRFAAPLLRREPEFHVVFLTRDPRDVVVSRHGLAPDRYWINLRIWKQALRFADALDGHPRVVRIAYERLVRDPEGVQADLAARLLFLRPTAPLREFARTATPSEQSLVAIHELRPIDSGSIGRWRDHKARVKGQLERHGPVTEDLIRLGYERDDAWLRELEGVEPDQSDSRHPERLTIAGRWKNWRGVRSDWRRYRRARRANPRPRG